jgi:8-oxo-dGTP pyrophosphatase MutT (NUDIX family)
MKIKRPEPTQPTPLHAKKVFQGKIFTMYQWEQELFNGKKAIFEKIERSDTVNVIPVTKDGKILLIKQEQPGIVKPFWGTPGGRVDPGEDALTAAKRELLEETGCMSNDFSLWYALQPSGMIEWAVYTFIARGCLQKLEQQLDGGEKIEVYELSFDEFIKGVLSPEFRDTEISLQILRLIEAKKLQHFKSRLLS